MDKRKLIHHMVYAAALTGLPLLAGCIHIRVPRFTLPHYGCYTIDSDPQGAHVFKPDGTYLGRTPTSIVNRSDGKSTRSYSLRLSKSGYREANHTYTATCDTASEGTARRRARKLFVILEPFVTLDDLGLQALPPEQRPTLAVIDFDVGENIPKDTGRAAADICRDALATTRRFKLMDRNHIKSILGEQDFVAAVRCDNTACIVRYGRVLQAQQMVHGRITALGDAYTLHIGMTDVNTSELLGQATAIVPGKLEELRDIAPGKVYEMVADTVQTP